MIGGYDTLPTIVLGAYDTRNAADAACSMCSVALCGLSVLVSVRQLHHDRARLRAMSKATTGLQWLMVTSTSAMGGQTATLDHDGTH